MDLLRQGLWMGEVPFRKNAPVLFPIAEIEAFRYRLSLAILRCRSTVQDLHRGRGKRNEYHFVSGVTWTVDFYLWIYQRPNAVFDIAQRFVPGPDLAGG